MSVPFAKDAELREATVQPPAPAAPVAAAPSGVDAVLALQRGAGNQAVARYLSAGAVLARADQRRGTGDLSAGQLRGIDAALHPGSAPAPGTTTPRTWDGGSGHLDLAARRAELAAELDTALNAFLDHEMTTVRRLADPALTPRATIAQMAGAGRAAKRVVDDMFGSWASAAALTQAQADLRRDFDFDAGTELVDRSDPAQFTTSIGDLADWIAETSSASRRAQRRHGFDKNRGGPFGEENLWLQADVLAPFVTARSADLDLFDRFGFADTTRRRVTIMPTLDSGGSTRPGPGGAPPSALRREQWSTWQLLVHEYLHTLEHPAFEEAHAGNRVMMEGFTEHFALQVLRRWVPIARAGSDPTLRTEVEGASPSGGPWGGFRREWVRSPDAGEYSAYVRQTRRIRDRIGAGGENALRGAFFQGHVELIGLEEDGDMLAAPLDLTDRVHVPQGIATRAQLATASGLSEAQIGRANRTLRDPAAAVTAGMLVSLRGCREHVIVQAAPTHDAPVGPARIETAAQVAAQHGIAEADVLRANPGVTWSSLHPGDHVLIPRH